MKTYDCKLGDIYVGFILSHLSPQGISVSTPDVCVCVTLGLHHGAHQEDWGLHKLQHVPDEGAGYDVQTHCGHQGLSTGQSVCQSVSQSVSLSVFSTRIYILANNCRLKVRLNLDDMHPRGSEHLQLFRYICAVQATYKTSRRFWCLATR